MADTERVRFAPSPTGYLHLGGARTALFNWLHARHHRGVLVLRIEDTDQVRSTPASVDAILQGMEWLGLNWDEGPFFQSQRLERYRHEAERLMAAGKAYRCICTPAELEQRRKQQLERGESPHYDGRCKQLSSVSADQPHAVRFKASTDGETTFDDAIHGPVTFQNKELDDFVIMRSDGLPTYNFAVVVDDADMNITLVIRGDDHISNTPKQLLLSESLGLEPPRFAHIPMILGPDRQRLSKRHGATSVIAYREMGLLPEAMVNYLVRLGWAHKDQEIFTRAEMIRLFSLDNVSKTAAIFDMTKLEWLNAQYVKQLPPDECVRRVRPFWEERTMPTEGYDSARLAAIVGTLQERSKTLAALAAGSHFYFTAQVEYEAEAAARFLKPDKRAVIRELRVRLAALTTFDKAAIEATFRELAAELGTKVGEIIQPCRVAVTGRAISPGMYEVLEILGKERTLQRLDDAISWLARVPA